MRRLLLTLPLLLASCGGPGESAAQPAPPVVSVPAPTPPTTAPPTTTPTPPAPTMQQRWSDAATWPGGKVPTAGEQVTLPQGVRVRLDVSPPDLAGLTIPAGSALEFAAQDLTLRAEWIMVHGELRVGTEQVPFAHRADIVLTDSKSGEDLMGMGDRVLGVMGGTLELHGQPRTPWLRLAQTARAGATSITLDAAPDWQPGDTLTLASTDFAANQTEQITVAQVSGNTVKLGVPLKFTHWGEVMTVAGAKVDAKVDERAEVGLLTHNVRVRADDDSAAENSTASGLGAHLMVMDGAQARIEGTEFTRVGQRNALRRYPVHFHLLGDAGASYFRGNSVHDSFNRCVVVHGTSNLRVQNNVTYNSVGHCFFLEDGAETGTTLSGNLATLVRRADAKLGETPLLESDESPAAYWITNPANTLTGNVAAGVDGTGFWYALPEHPTGAAAASGQAVWPRRTPLGSFSGNVAHSADTGLNVDNGPTANGSRTEVTYYAPRSTPADEKSAPAPADFAGFTAYKNRVRGVWLRGEHLRVSGAVLADNAVGATFAASDATLSGALLVGETANVGQPESWEKTGVGGRSLPRPWEVAFPVRGFEFYDGPVRIERTHLAAFVPSAVRPASGLGYLLNNAFPLSPRNTAAALTWLDASNRVYFGPPQAERDGDLSALFLDEDGTVGAGLAGTGAGRAITASTLLDTPDCAAQAAWNGKVCTGAYARLWLDDGGQAGFGPLTVARPDGVGVTLAGTPGTRKTFSTSVRVGESYTLKPASLPRRLRLGLDAAAPGQTLRLTVGAAAEPILYRDWWIDNRNRLKKIPLADLNAATGDSYAYAGGKLYLKLVVKPGSDYAVLDVCAADLCQ